MLEARAYLHVTRSSVKSGTRSSALSSAALAAASAVVASTRHRSLPTTVGVSLSCVSAVTASVYRHDACHVDGRCFYYRDASGRATSAQPRRDLGATSARPRRNLGAISVHLERGGRRPALTGHQSLAQPDHARVAESQRRARRAKRGRCAAARARVEALEGLQTPERVHVAGTWAAS